MSINAPIHQHVWTAESTLRLTENARGIQSYSIYPQVCSTYFNITLFNEMVIQPLANCKVAPEPEAFPEGGLTCSIISSHHHHNNNNNNSREEEWRIKQAHLHTSLIFFNRLQLSLLQVLQYRIFSARRLWKLQWFQVQDLQTSVVTDNLCSKNIASI